MKTYLIKLSAVPKNDIGIISKKIEVTIDSPIEDIIKDLFLKYLNIEVYSVEYDTLLSKFSAKSLDYDVYIDYED